MKPLVTLFFFAFVQPPYFKLPGLQSYDTFTTMRHCSIDLCTSGDSEFQLAPCLSGYDPKSRKNVTFVTKLIL